MKLAASLLLTVVASLQAQNTRYFIPRSIYPGSRLTVYSDNTSATQPAPLPTLTIAAQGREYTLPLIAQPFPPAEEINPKPTQLPVYLVPRDLPLGSVTVRYGDLVMQSTVSSRPLNQLYSLGLMSAYAQQRTGTGPTRRNRLSDSVRPGDLVTLWGTGFDRVAVSIGGTQVSASVEHQSDGLDRIEFILPDNVTPSCSQLVRVNQTPATIAVAAPDSATCPHHLGITPNDLLKLDRGQSIPVSQVGFSVQGIGVFFGEASILGLPPGPEILPFFAVGAPLEQVATGCNVTAFPEVDGGSGSVSSQEPGPGIGTPKPPPEKTFMAEMISPEGVRYTAESSEAGYFGFFNPTNESIWIPGTWTFRSLSPATGVLMVKARRPFRWKTEPDFANYSRERDFVLEWDPTLGDAEDTVTFVYGQFSERAVNGIIGHQVVCGAPMNAGKLVVPASLMRAIQWVPTQFDPYLGASHYFHPSTFRAPDGRYVQVSY